jgi:ABC-type bacteriocin/lantibiotic exporter with double-glycine peptidase domain
VKWQTYHTHQEGDSDCGPACVRSVLRRHGILVAAPVLRESVGLGDSGASLLRLGQVIDDYGIDTALYRLDVEELHQAVSLAGPAIVLLKEDGYNHFVVVHDAVLDGGFVVSDPLFYRPVLMSRGELGKFFSGQTLMTGTPAVGLSRRARWSHAWAESIFVQELTENLRTIAVILATTLIVGALSISSSIYLQVSVDKSLASVDVNALSFTSMAFLGMIAAGGVVQYIRGLLIVRFGQHMQRKLSERYVGKLMRLPTQFFGGRRTGDLASRLDDVQGIQALLTSTTIGVSVDIAIVLIVGGYLAWESPVLFGILLASSCVAAVTSWGLYRGIREASEEALQRDASLKSELINVLNHHEVVFSHGKRDFAGRRIAHTLSRRIESQTRLGRLGNVSATVELLNHGFFTIVAAWAGLMQVRSGMLSLGQLFGFISLSGYFLTSLENISTLQTTLQRASAAMGRYREIVRHREADDQTAVDTDGGVRADEGLGSIRVEDLSFSYPGAARPVFDHYSVSVPAGSAVYLAGSNASGKSTLLKLVAGLYTAAEGSVRVSGRQITAPVAIGKRVRALYLPENPLIINATVWENLVMGADYSRAQVDRACALACAEGVIASFDDGYDEVIREDRARLSRGQLQRLALARALLMDVEVYLFDEAFSGVDRDSFREIWKSLVGLPATKLLVAHRETSDMHFDLSVELPSLPSAATATLVAAV